jgi:uncharacterized protein
MKPTPVVQRFTAALDALVAQLRKDDSVLAAILCGSLSHDTVWERSDIDLVLVTLDERHAESGGVALFADGVNVHTVLMPRTKFRSVVEGSIQNSFIHSLLAKGRLLYTHDESIERLCQRLREVGERDARLQLLCAATGALPCIDKAHKWLVTRADLDYTALWILSAAEALARIEVIEHGLVADREVLPQALTLNPEFFSTVYTALLNQRKTTKAVKEALDAVDAYVDARIPTIFEPLFTYLREIGEARSATEIEAHFSRNFGVGGVTTACEYLAAKGRIGKASVPVRLTKRSHIDMQELAFYHLGMPEPEEDLPPGARPKGRAARAR